MQQHADGAAAPPIGNPALVATCESSERRLLRIVSPDGDTDNQLPWPGSTVFVACQGLAFPTD